MDLQHRSDEAVTLSNWIGSTHSLEDGNSISSDISRRSEPQPTNKSSTQVTEYVSIQVGHYQHIKLSGVLHQLNTQRYRIKDNIHMN